MGVHKDDEMTSYGMGNGLNFVKREKTSKIDRMRGRGQEEIIFQSNICVVRDFLRTSFASETKLL
jgi:hypothetical protein